MSGRKRQGSPLPQCEANKRIKIDQQLAQVDPRSFIHCRVAKEFSGTLHYGTVTKYDNPYRNISYDDGDQEQYDAVDMKDHLLEEAKSAPSKSDPMLYISCRVAKEFEDELHHGTVTDYDEEANYWKILYDDNDSEEYDEEALEMALLEEAKSAPSKPDPRSYINFRVAKVFKRKEYRGTVTGYDEEANYWPILYDDGDSEDYAEEDMKKYLTPFMSGNSWKVAHSSEGGNKIGSRIIERIRVVENNVKKETTLLSHVLGERLLSMEIPLNVDEAKKRFDPRFEMNGSQYQLVSRKVLSDGSVPSWGPYRKPKCVNLLYAQVTDPRWAPLSIKETLLKLADFSALTPAKVVARLELLQSPAHKFKNKNNAPGLIFIPSSEVYRMEDTGYDRDGCGFIEEEKFEEILIPLVGKEAAKRSFSFQGRFVVPTKGIFKGMFCKSRTTNRQPIQLPSSMLKVPASVHPDRHDGAAMLICKHKLHPAPKTINYYIGRKLNRSSNAKTETFAKLCEQKPLSPMITRLWRCLGVPEKECCQYARQCLKPKRRNHAWIVGLADPTGSIPPGHVFVPGTQKCSAAQGEIFVTRSPCTKPYDGRMLPTATSNQMPAHDWEWLSSWSFGCIIFGNPKPGTMSIPEQVAGGDLDGDDYFVCWDREILSHVNAQPIACNQCVARKPVVGENATGDPNWFENAQNLLIDAEKMYGIERLIRELWTLAKKIADESEMFLADPDAIAASLAYDQALKSSKHGTKVTLPNHLRGQLPEVLQKFVDIAE